MKLNFLLILVGIVPIFSLSIFSKKKCMNCKHFIKPEGDRQVGKCSLFPILNDVDDTEDDIDHYLDCIRSRKNYFCGEKGRYYEKFVPNEEPFLSLVDPSFFDQISEFDFEQFIQFL